MKTKYKFGLIGRNINYSFSPDYFAKKFKKLNIDAIYDLYDLKNISEIKNIISDSNLIGLNVTIPYKQAILPYLDEISPQAKKIKAVNTIFIHNKKLIGYNTDVYGFRKSLEPLLKLEYKNALILGTGGATLAVKEALNQLKIKHKTVSRNNPKADYFYDELNEKIITENQIIINATPVGTHPKTDDIPKIPIEYINHQHLVYDLIYNPKKTALLKSAEENNAIIKNGLEMLQLQAEKAWEIWKNHELLNQIKK